MTVEPSNLVWKKSSLSMETNCVEVANSGDLIFMRNSKDPSGPTLTFTNEEWAAFLLDIKVRGTGLPG